MAEDYGVALDAHRAGKMIAAAGSLGVAIGGESKGGLRHVDHPGAADVLGEPAAAGQRIG